VNSTGSGDGPSRVRTDLSRYAGLGLQFAATMGVFGWAGFWLDGKWGTSPWLMVAGIFLGFVGGTISMVKKVFPSE